MASCILKAMSQQKWQDAAYLAVNASARATNNAFFEEINSLAAITLAKAGHAATSLEYWDKIIKKSPQKLKWLEAGLQYAWSLANKKAEEMACQWQDLLTRVFISAPSPQILARLDARGWMGIGSIGIHKGKLKGWLWLDQQDRVKINSTLPQNLLQPISVKIIGKTDKKILYAIEQDLLDAHGQYGVAITNNEGKCPLGSPLICSPAKLKTSAKTTRKNSETVPIIIPVFGDYKATIRCIASVAASLKHNRTKCRVIALWDQGPEKKLLDALSKLAAKGLIELVKNERNLGFLASINSYLNNCPLTDIILLNSDTLTHGDWIDRMAETAKNKDAATVTALSNEAELMSFPSVFDRGKISGLKQLKILDMAASHLKDEFKSGIIPVGVGFCMYITRKALQKLGGFDGVELFRGYGEEVDFCLRAKEQGLKNYGAFNVFVAHMGEKSFGISKKALAAQNNEAIYDHFPDYRQEYDAYLYEDAPTAIRREISIEALKHIKMPMELEVRPWGASYLPPWWKDKNTEPERPRAGLFLKAGENPRALLRIWCDTPLADMFFTGKNELTRLKNLLFQLKQTSAKGYQCSPEILNMASKLLNLNISCENLPPVSDSLSAANAGDNFFVAPPLTMSGWKALRKLASFLPGSKFSVFQLSSLWPGLPLPHNIFPAPPIDSLPMLNARGLIFPEGTADINAWDAWLAGHNVAKLPYFRPEMA